MDTHDTVRLGDTHRYRITGRKVIRSERAKIHASGTMTTHSKLFTRHEITALDAYTTGAQVIDIAATLGISQSTTWRYLQMLGLHHVQRYAIAQPIPDDSPLRCDMCSILLSEAETEDGPGSETTCRYCLCLKAGIPLRAPIPLAGGSDPILRVFEAYGMAAGRDDR